MKTTLSDKIATAFLLLCLAPFVALSAVALGIGTLCSAEGWRSRGFVLLAMAFLGGCSSIQECSHRVLPRTTETLAVIRWQMIPGSFDRDYEQAWEDWENRKKENQ